MDDLETEKWIVFSESADFVNVYLHFFWIFCPAALLTKETVKEKAPTLAFYFQRKENCLKRINNNNLVIYICITNCTLH